MARMLTARCMEPTVSVVAPLGSGWHTDGMLHAAPT